MNDVFLAINQRPQQYISTKPIRRPDLSGRATGGIPSYGGGHAIIANARRWNSVGASAAIPDFGGL
jgi:hypothetical protein